MRNTTFDVSIPAVSVERQAAHPEGYAPLKLVTNHGEILCRYYPCEKKTTCGAIWVGGVGGGWDTPAKGLYPLLSADLQHKDIASLRVRFRNPTILEEAVFDVLAGIQFLQSEGIENIALIGHSFGGAVVIQAAAMSEVVKTVVTLATQSYGAKGVSELSPRASILFLHGQLDHVLPADCSKVLYNMAEDPKSIQIFQGADHGLDEVALEVHERVGRWIQTKLIGAMQGPIPGQQAAQRNHLSQ